jgi:hypothetical protein
MIFNLANHRNPNSLAARLRRKRFEEFKQLTDSVPRPMNILDVGGSQGVWETIGFVGRSDVQITLINIDPMQTSGSNIRNVVGDARTMPQFRDHEFDLVFSNSVIEHVGGPDDMKRLADEIRRVGRRYFIQTPNRYFPIEPHFLFPMFQFLPVSVQTALVQNFKLGWYPRMPERADAEREVRSIRLLTHKELRGLFPDGVVVSERLFGVPKCLLAYKI